MTLNQIRCYLRCSLLNAQGLVTKRTNKLQSEEFQQFFNSSDVVLLVETWTNELSNIDVSNFQAFVLNRNENKKSSKRSSGGIILYLRHEYVSNDTLIYTDHDDIVWIKIDKTLCSLDNDLFIGLCYVVPDNSSRQSMMETNIFDRLLDSVVFIENMSQGNCNLLLCGDFNSRTSNNPDFVADDGTMHMSVLPDDYVPDTQMPRFSEDEGHTNDNGLLLLDFCKQTGLRIMNGRVGDDKGIGSYTFVGHRGSSLVDYVLSSQNMFQYVNIFEVQEPNILSDHCLIKFSFEFSHGRCHSQENEQYETIFSKYKWKSERKPDFLHSLQQNAVTDQLNTLNTNISRCSNGFEIEACVSDFVNIIDEVSTPMSKKKF